MSSTSCQSGPGNCGHTSCLDGKVVKLLLVLPHTALVLAELQQADKLHQLGLLRVSVAAAGQLLHVGQGEVHSGTFTWPSSCRVGSAAWATLQAVTPCCSAVLLPWRTLPASTPFSRARQQQAVAMPPKPSTSVGTLAPLPAVPRRRALALARFLEQLLADWRGGTNNDVWEQLALSTQQPEDTQAIAEGAALELQLAAHDDDRTGEACFFGVVLARLSAGGGVRLREDAVQDLQAACAALLGRHLDFAARIGGLRSSLAPPPLRVHGGQLGLPETLCAPRTSRLHSRGVEVDGPL
ncbi:unnamed protein product [Prorocentrum cordatum]|uniref:Anaphase-promoting complex subunit 1 n=1 Tax=Prorocentrum cordatum TaxID=2364126 RepID=A0ABN9TMD1_9DINO|nr:unnamed protein product [Polarella glacialis]